MVFQGLFGPAGTLPCVRVGGVVAKGFEVLSLELGNCYPRLYPHLWVLLWVLDLTKARVRSEEGLPRREGLAGCER